MKCPICIDRKMVVVIDEAMGSSYWCEKCKNTISYDYDHGKIIIDGFEEKKEGE